MLQGIKLTCTNRPFGLTIYLLTFLSADSFVDDPFQCCYATELNFSGGNGEGETPVPIPNTAVKPLSADGTAWATAWESRSPPGVIFKDP